MIAWLPLIFFLGFLFIFCLAGFCYKHSKSAIYWCSATLIAYGISVGLAYLFSPLIAGALNNLLKKYIDFSDLTLDTKTILQPYCILVFTLVCFIILIAIPGSIGFHFIKKSYPIQNSKKNHYSMLARFGCAILMGGASIPFDALVASTGGTGLQLGLYDDLYEFNDESDSIKTLSLTCFDLPAKDFSVFNFATTEMFKIQNSVGFDFFDNLRSFLDVNAKDEHEMISWIDDNTESDEGGSFLNWIVQLNLFENIDGLKLSEHLTNVFKSNIYRNVFFKIIEGKINGVQEKIEHVEDFAAKWDDLTGADGWTDTGGTNHKVQMIGDCQIKVPEYFFDSICEKWVTVRVNPDDADEGLKLAQKIIGVIFEPYA